MIQGKKKNKFFLPDPKDPSKSRENDSEYAENVKELNTLQLIDYDSEYGSIYFANGGHISVLNSAPLGEESKIQSGMEHHSIGLDSSYIKAIRVFHSKEDAYIAV
jgi:hypothetical protein